MKKNAKAKLAAALGGTGFACAVGCTIPFLGFLGLGTVESLFCENKTLQIGGILITALSVIYLIWHWRGRKVVGGCTTNKDCQSK